MLHEKFLDQSEGNVLVSIEDSTVEQIGLHNDIGDVVFYYLTKFLLCHLR